VTSREPAPGVGLRYRVRVTHERVIAVRTHGRYLVDVAPGHPTRSLLVGFHGYGEHASIQLERLRAVRAASPWDLVSIQGLHRFYARGGERTVASWMTREDRERLIDDNIAYIDAVLDAVAAELGEPTSVVFTGFSQGASMAYRAGALCARRGWGVIAAGGDVPPDLTDAQIARIPRALIGVGERDQWFTSARCAADVERLRGAGVDTTRVLLDAAHEWPDALTTRASEWLAAWR
jgi:predicted esterase